MFSGCRVGRRKRSLWEVGWESASFRPPPPFQMHAWVLSPDFLCLNWVCGLWLWHHIHTFNFYKKKREKKKPHWERHYSESAFWHQSFRDGTENYFSPIPTGSVHSHPLFCFLQDTKFFFTPKHFWPVTDLLCPLGKKKQNKTQCPGEELDKSRNLKPQRRTRSTVCSHHLAILVAGDKEQHNQDEELSLKSLHSETPLKHVVFFFFFSFIRSFHTA